jgi:hypothetical protein
MNDPVGPGPINGAIVRPQSRVPKRAERLLEYLKVAPGSPPLTIYLAGKISKNDWRHDVVPCLSSAQDGDGVGDYAHWEYTDWTVVPTVNPDVGYRGPYFTGCDHGCGHTTLGAAHGVCGDDGCWGAEPCSRQRVMQLCLAAIEHADIFFAWLAPDGPMDDCTAYGTLAELGYAKARGCRVITSAPSLDTDLWFVHHMADVNIAADDPIAGLAAALIAVGMRTTTQIETCPAADAHNARVDAWERQVSWCDILFPAGWVLMSSPDTCGCLMLTAPGDPTSTATAHEADCIKGPDLLHIWAAPSEGPFACGFNGTLTRSKLQAMAAIHYGGDVDAVLTGRPWLI